MFALNKKIAPREKLVLNRPLHLCEVLEDEHVALYGEEWHVTAADILDPAAVVEACRRELKGTFVQPSAEEIHKLGEEAAVAKSVNALIDLDGSLSETLHANIADVRQRNRRIVESFAREALARAGAPGWEVRPSQVRDPAGLARQWRRKIESEPPAWLCDSQNKSVEECRAEIAKGLNELIHGAAIVTRTYPKLTRQMALSTRQLIAQADVDTLTPEERVYLNRRVLDDVFGGYIQRGEEARLAKIYEVIHASEGTSALCISGGGIRSATFGLGVLQGLARRNLLHRFDYVSTVSGGGYIGSWLSSWMRRHAEGSRGVAEDLASPPMDKLEPEPKPVEHLREFSNYLTPRLGVLSGDTLAVAAVYVRNLLLNWTILVPLLLAALVLPRMVHAVYFRSLSADVSTSLTALAETTVRAASLATIGLPGRAGDVWLGEAASWIAEKLLVLAALIDSGSSFFLIDWMRRLGLFEHTAAWIGGLSLLSAVIYLCANRPTVNRFGEVRVEVVQKKFIWLCLVPFIVACIALTAAWSRMTMHGADAIPLSGFALFIAVPMAAGGIYLYHYSRATASDRRESVLATIMRQEKSIFDNKAFREFLAASASSLVSAVLVWILAAYVFPHPWDVVTPETFPSPILALHQRLPVSAFYVCFAVPLLLSVFFIAATVFVGVSSAVNEDYDREWWARCCGYALGAVVVWILVTGVVIFGPVALHFAPRAIGAAGGIAGVISIILGRSHKTGANDPNEKSISDIVAACAAPVFILFLLAVGSLLTSRLFEPDRRIDAASAAMLESIRWSAEQKSAVAGAGVDAMRMAGFRSEKIAPIGSNAVPMLADGSALQLKAEIEKRHAFDAARFGAWVHLLTVSESQLPPLALFFGLLVFLATTAARSVNVNKFSMHSMYRNRLIRAYLGASRSTRDPHPFTGFDPQDNVAMHQLRPELLWASSFRDLDGFVHWLTGKATAAPGEEPKAAFSKRLRAKLDKVQPALFEHTDRPEFVAELFQVLNCVLETDDLDKPERDPHRASLWNVKAYITQRKLRPLKSAPETTVHDPRRLRRNRQSLDRNFAREIYPFDFPLLCRGDIASYVDLAATLTEPMLTMAQRQTAQMPSKTLAWIRQHLGAAARAALKKCNDENEHLGAALATVLTELNRILLEHDLTKLEVLGGKAYPADYQRVRENRKILDAALANAIHPLSTPRTMHVVNVALNLVSGEKLGWQERKAQSFTVTPMHSGSYTLGYRQSTHFGADSGITLGTAVTISGAAVSPNMGYHSSPPLAFLLTLFNVRLGWWLGNPGPFGGSTWTNECPTLALRPLLAELSGSTNECFPYVYLSDGGHFENLGLYEMVLRRRRYIVVSDAGCDPTHAFEDLGNAIRKIRTDLGVPIEINHMSLYPRSQKDGETKVGRYCAVGTIRYSCVDPGATDGRLLYIKPAVYMTEPKDIYNYAKSSNAFPHESTADQWFSESQFESYRMLGSHAVDRICTGGDDDCNPVKAQNWLPATFEDFFDRARKHAEKDLAEGRAEPPSAVKFVPRRRRRERRP